MKNEKEILKIESMIDFTLLDPRATEFDLEKMCDIAYKHSYYSVCVNSCNVSYVKSYIRQNLNDSIKVVSVVGFPLGASTVETKIFEAREVINNGADEIDFVINISKLKQGKIDYVKNELKKMRSACKKKILKAIIETCYLDKNEIIKISRLCSQTKIDFVKTSTGFGVGGATIEDVKLIYETSKENCKVKVSGGIRSRDQAIDFINQGVSRIGTSHIL